MKRVASKDLDALLGTPFAVLDHGYVIPVDYVGNDSSIATSARISYGSGGDPSADARLIRYLMRHRHTSPFEMPSITLRIKMPIFVMRQLVRHRTASLNEVSARYTELPEEFFALKQDEWRTQDDVNKQGSSGSLSLETGRGLSNEQLSHQESAYEVYRDRLKAGVAREIARVDLPLSTYTEVIWKMDLHNLFHFLGLRSDPHAQKEIREFAAVIATIVEYWCPVAFRAWVDYQFKAIRLSVFEQAILGQLVVGDKESVQTSLEMWTSSGRTSLSELKEFSVKLGGMGLFPDSSAGVEAFWEYLGANLTKRVPRARS